MAQNKLPTSKLEELLRQYFRIKQKQLLAASELVVTEHSVLRGNHREEVIRIYLSEILPKRFEVGRGMVYGFIGQSHECDIVIWDAINYPSLQLYGHNIFFAESVRAVLEIKSQWNSSEFEDIKKKCEALSLIFAPKEYNSLADEIVRLKLDVLSLQTGKEHEGMLIAPDRIGTGAFIFRGGQNLWKTDFSKDELGLADDCWPDVTLLMEAGIVIRKHYEGEPAGGGTGILEFIHAGEDALLVFTASWLALLTVRSVQTEDPLYFEKYIQAFLQEMPIRYEEFPLRRPLPGRWPVWK